MEETKNRVMSFLVLVCPHCPGLKQKVVLSSSFFEYPWKTGDLFYQNQRPQVDDGYMLLVAVTLSGILYTSDGLRILDPNLPMRDAAQDTVYTRSMSYSPYI